MKKIAYFSLAFLLFSVGAGESLAATSVVRESNIAGAPGFRFENLRFELDYMTLEIVNSNKENLTFTGTMTFLDMRGRVVAEAELLPRRFVAGRRLFYKTHFTMGSSGAARRALKIIWRTQITR